MCFVLASFESLAVYYLGTQGVRTRLSLTVFLHSHTCAWFPNLPCNSYLSSNVVHITINDHRSPMSCDYCQRISIERGGSEHAPSLVELEASAQSCWLCHKIYFAVLQKVRDEPNKFRWPFRLEIHTQYGAAFLKIIDAQRCHMARLWVYIVAKKGVISPEFLGICC
jgi:hypothetical protein